MLSSRLNAWTMPANHATDRRTSGAAGILVPAGPRKNTSPAPTASDPTSLAVGPSLKRSSTRPSRKIATEAAATPATGLLKRTEREHGAEGSRRDRDASEHRRRLPVPPIVARAG